MAARVAAAEYGNADISGDIQSFWLDGALRTSAVDQLAFLEALATGALPFDASAQADVVASMPTQTSNTYTLRHKTGTALASNQPVAWLVGIVETAKTTYVFAYNVALADGAGNSLESVPSAAERLAVVEELLASAGVIQD